jgi:hypothetical protein
MTFFYRQRSRVEAEWRARDAARRVKLQQATRDLVDEGNKAWLCAFLREDGLDDLADQLERARFPGRGIPLLEGHVRRHEKRYGKRERNGKLLYGERQRAVDSILRALIETGELSLEDEHAIADWRKAHELCERLEREAEADEEMSLEQYRRKIKPGMTALREAMCQDHDIAALREKMVENLNRDARREPRLHPPSGSVVVPFAR